MIDLLHILTGASAHIYADLLVALGLAHVAGWLIDHRGWAFQN